MNRYSPLSKMLQKNVLVCAICLVFSSFFYDFACAEVYSTLTVFLWVLTDFAHVSGRLKEIVGILINCFQDFIPLIHAPRGFDAPSFNCINHILCSIGYAIKFSIRRHTQRQTTWLPASEEVTLMILDQDIASMLSKKLLGSFPLNPENNLSGKV